jgi:hypothetical protein
LGIGHIICRFFLLFLQHHLVAEGIHEFLAPLDLSLYGLRGRTVHGLEGRLAEIHLDLARWLIQGFQEVDSHCLLSKGVQFGLSFLLVAWWLLFDGGILRRHLEEMADLFSGLKETSAVFQEGTCVCCGVKDLEDFSFELAIGAAFHLLNQQGAGLRVFDQD